MAVVCIGCISMDKEECTQRQHGDLCLHSVLLWGLSGPRAQYLQLQPQAFLLRVKSTAVWLAESKKQPLIHLLRSDSVMLCVQHYLRQCGWCMYYVCFMYLSCMCITYISCPSAHILSLYSRWIHMQLEVKNPSRVSFASGIELTFLTHCQNPPWCGSYICYGLERTKVCLLKLHRLELGPSVAMLRDTIRKLVQPWHKKRFHSAYFISCNSWRENDKF